MRSYTKSTPDLLRKRLAMLQKELEATAPGLVAEIRLVEQLLKASNVESAKTYKGIEKARLAIRLCLDLNGEWTMSKDEMMAEILNNGYLTDKPEPKKATDLLNDSFNYHLRKKILIEKDGKIGRNPKREKTRKEYS